MDKEKTDIYICPNCNGKGRIEDYSRYAPYDAPCSVCSGTGAITASIKIIRKENNE